MIEDSEGTIYSKTPEGYYQKKRTAVNAEPIQELDGLITRMGWDCFLADKEGGIWLTISEKGLFRKAPQGTAFQKIDYGDTLSSVGYFKIVIDEVDDDILWLGTTLGLCRLNWKTGAKAWFYPQMDIPILRSNRVTIFEQFSNDQIWLYYTYSRSIGYFDKNQGRFILIDIPEAKRKYLEGHIKDIAISSDGNLWLASLFGLTNYNIHNQEFKIYGKKDGIIENELQAVLIDKNENLWVSGNRFISMLDRENNAFINYQDTRRMRNFLSRSRYIAPDGNILFGAINGIYAFNPDYLKKNPTPPDLVLTNFTVNNETYVLSKAFEDTQSITLASDQNNVTFEFSGLHYVESAPIEYKCILEGYENEWRDLGREHKIRYTNLSHGDYTFKVSAANLDGTWNNEGIVIPLRISPAFWQTIWFKAILLLLALLIGNAIYRNRRQQLLLQRQKEVAEQSAAYKTRFLADVSHEIRTPMNAIIGLSKLAMDTKLNDKQHRFVNAIQESSQNLLAIINDLLDHTKLESGKFQFTKKQFELSGVVKNIENTLGHTAREKALFFNVKLDEVIPQKLIGDPIRLNQILTNLIGNSIKFTNVGRIWLTVGMKQELENEVLLKFEVGDTGIGISPDKLEFIFGSWNQTNAGVNKGMEGTGLGLAITKQLVERQQGALQLRSEEGVGTVVSFMLKFDKITAEEHAAGTQAAKPELSDLRILVVEDTYFNQMLIEEFLNKNIQNGFITLAENGKVALEELRKTPFDLVLMDVKMPVMDGFEATKIIRKMEDEQLRNIPIIAVTASAVQDQLDKCKQAGMDNYITKPIDEQDLLQKIHFHTQK